MTEEKSAASQDALPTPHERVRPLIRVRQMRNFTPEPVSRAELDAMVEVARWSGSSTNSQPWRFIVLQDESTLRSIAEAALPQTRALQSAPAGIVITLPKDPAKEVSFAYDEGRAAERILIAASMLGLGAGICWILPRIRPQIAEILRLPDDRMVRTVVAIGHPTEAATQPKSAPGQARLPREQTVFEDRWPRG